MRKNRLLDFVICLLTIAQTALSSAQGPRPSYFYDPGTELSFASCVVHFEGGSKSKIPFMPMVNHKRAPCGTFKYTKDIEVDAPIVFVGNGIVKENEYDSYRDVEVKGKAVMFCYDFPDSVNAALEKSVSTQIRIEEAVAKGASCVILFSNQREFPLFSYPNKNLSEIPEIPIILITRESAKKIISATGYEPEMIFENWKNEGKVESIGLVSKLSLKVKGKFDRIETKNFSFVYRSSTIPAEEMEKLVETNEKSVSFILGLFEEEGLEWEKSFVAYFRDYDSKVFYVNHWGKGLSNDSGIFMFYDGKMVEYDLAVHENMHKLIYLNWGKSSSFMVEAFGMYAEAKATDANSDHNEVIRFLMNGELPRLDKMIKIDIGGDPLTQYAYPASGSFIDFLIRNYGIGKVREAYEMENTESDTWNVIFNKSIQNLEMNWLEWISDEYDVEESYIEAHLKKN